MADQSLKFFGGYGYRVEYPISRFWADARVLRIYGGTSEVMKGLVARALLGRSAASPFPMPSPAGADGYGAAAALSAGPCEWRRPGAHFRR